MMRLSASAKEFSNGFDKNDDIFRRRGLHDNIMRVVANAVDKSLVLALDDKWGNGKTSFVKMMESEIKINYSEKIEVIYFDAFKSDYQSDPFIALTANIYAMTKKDSDLEKLGGKLLNIGKKLGASFAIHGSKLAISTVTAGLVSGTGLEKMGESISESLSSPLEMYIEEKIKTSEKEVATIEKFGETLTDIHKKSNKKILFIIDELDRARPDFSLELLEKIKHIFSVEGVIFLLVVNREQFEKSIESKYGNINSKLYLNKFVHYWFTLPKVSHYDRDCLAGYNQSTIKRYLLSIDADYSFLSKNLVVTNILAGLLELNECSLREAERCYSVFTIMDPNIFSLQQTDTYRAAAALVTFLKVHNSTLLTEILAKKHSLDRILALINIGNSQLDNTPEFRLLMRVIEYHYSLDEEISRLRATGEYRDIEGPHGKRFDLLTTLYSAVEGFEVRY